MAILKRYSPMAGSLRTILALSAITPLALGVTILPSSAGNGFPACALSCSTLVSAADSCEADPSGQQSIIDSCFCQSALLTSLHSSSNEVCDSSCGSSDLTSLESWYNSWCSSATAAGVQTTAATGSTTVATVSATTTDAGVAAATTTASSSRASSAKSSQHHTWWTDHWRWVIMLIVLVIAFPTLIVLAVWLRRRSHAKVTATRTPTPMPFMTERHPPSGSGAVALDPARDRSIPHQPSVFSLPSTRTGTMQSNRSRSGTMQSRRGDMREVWGPHQHQAATQGWEYTNPNDSNTLVGGPEYQSDTPSPNDRHSTSSKKASASARSREKISDFMAVDEVDEGRDAIGPVGSGGGSNNGSANSRRKLSRRSSGNGSRTRR